jgi:putative transposase
VIKAYKFRIYPTVKQSIFLDQNFGATRFLWNQLVNNFNNYDKPEYIKNMNEMHLKSNNIWMKDVISYALQQKSNDFYNTVKQYFNKARKKKLGRIKFKKRGISNDSFRIPAQILGYMKAFDFKNNKIKLPKMKPINIKYDRVFNGLVKNVTISKNKCNEYYVSVCVDEKIDHKVKTNRDIGIDLGITALITTSSGIKINNPKYFRESQAELRKAQKHFSRKVKGSKRRDKQKYKVAKIHQKVSRQRNWLYHQISNYLIDNYDSIFIEDLAVSNMIKNRKLSKAIADSSWTILTSMIEYKSKWYGKEMVKVGRFYASSKLCSNCGHKHDNMTLGMREWVCPVCHSKHDRDINAAKNIYKEGMMISHGLLSDELTDYSHGEDVRPLNFMFKADFTEVINKTKII